MNGRRSITTLFALIAAGLIAGCSGSSPFLAGGTSVGTLKTNLSQVEFQNEQLRKEIASLKTSNRRLDQELVQEQEDNEQLATRLDNARELLDNRGIESRTSSTAPSSAGDRIEGVSTPKFRKSTRKPPSASIPGGLEPAREPAPNDSGALSSPPVGRFAAGRKRDDRWLPVARGPVWNPPVTR